MSVLLVLLVLFVRFPLFAFALPLASLERVDLHPVVIIRTCSISS